MGLREVAVAAGELNLSPMGLANELLLADFPNAFLEISLRLL